MRRRIGAVLALLALLPGAGGCWDFRPLEHRAPAVMIGVDRAAGDRFRVSLQFQIARPEQRGGNGGGGPATYRVITGEGETVRAAEERARADVAREVDTTFVSIVVIGERAAADLADIDFVVRSFRVPPTSFVGVARGEAEPVLRAESPAFGVPAEYLRSALTGWTHTPALVRVYTWTMFHRDFYTPLVDPHAPALTERKYGLNWDGMAVFRGHSLAGFLDEDEASLFNLTRGGRLEGAVDARIPGGGDRGAAIYLQRGKARRWVTWGPDGPVLHLRLQAAGDLRELRNMSIADPAAQRLVETELARALESDLTRVLKRLQELEADPIGFGELARRAAPYRREVLNGDAWHAAYRTAAVEVGARVRIIGTGFTK